MTNSGLWNSWYAPKSVESFWGALEQLPGSLGDIGAHQEFKKSDLFMPELLLKELDPV